MIVSSQVYIQEGLKLNEATICKLFWDHQFIKGKFSFSIRFILCILSNLFVVMLLYHYWLYPVFKNFIIDYDKFELVIIQFHNFIAAHYINLYFIIGLKELFLLIILAMTIVI